MASAVGEADANTRARLIRGRDCVFGVDRLAGSQRYAAEWSVGVGALIEQHARSSGVLAATSESRRGARAPVSPARRL